MPARDRVRYDRLMGACIAARAVMGTYSLVSEEIITGPNTHSSVTQQIRLRFRLILANVSIESQIATEPCGESIDAWTDGLRRTNDMDFRGFNRSKSASTRGGALLAAM
jgi:hypothetical protein